MRAVNEKKASLPAEQCCRHHGRCHDNAIAVTLGRTNRAEGKRPRACATGRLHPRLTLYTPSFTQILFGHTVADGRTNAPAQRIQNTQQGRVQAWELQLSTALISKDHSLMRQQGMRSGWRSGRGSSGNPHHRRAPSPRIHQPLEQICSALLAIQCPSTALVLPLCTGSSATTSTPSIIIHTSPRASLVPFR